MFRVAVKGLSVPFFLSPAELPKHISHIITIRLKAYNMKNGLIIAAVLSAFTGTATLHGSESPSSITLLPAEDTVDIGMVQDSSDVVELEGTVFSAEKKTVVYRLDRKRISGNSSISASGGSAVDILRNTPSIRIDADGEVSFRGSTGFLVYVDGKPSMLEGTQALEQIPAANIEDIEIITSPPARYRTDGDAGIINIVTRKNTAEGFGGSVSVSGSTIGTWSGDALLSWNRGSHRWYVEGSGSQIRGRSRFSQQKETETDDYRTFSDANGFRHSTVSSYIGKAGWEYSGERHHAVIEIQSGVTDNARGGDMSYYEHRSQGNAAINEGTYDSHDRYSNEKRLAQASAEYTYRLNSRGDRISAQGRLRYDWYALEYTESNMFTPEGARHEGTRGYEDEYHWDYDWDIRYEMRYRPEGKLEAGWQMTSYSEVGDYSIRYWDRDAEEFQWQDDMYARFFYRRQIYSLYAMVTDRYGPFSFDAGLRGDITHDIMEITVKDASRNLKRAELFPSLHVSYNAPGDNTISAGYSFRTNRPGIWKLEPYITYEDYYTRLIGNPDIRPEYTHSAEAGYRKVFGKNRNSISVTGFFRARKGTVDLVRRAYQPGVTLDSLINAGNDLTYGIEAEAGIKAAGWWDIRLGGSLFKYDFTSTYKGSMDASNISYTANMTNTFKAGRNTRIQFDSYAIGPAIISQGTEKAYFYFDIAVRQQLLGDRMALSLVFHDAFHTAEYRNIRSMPGLVSNTYVRPVYPNILLSVSYSFNAAGHKERSRAVSSGSIFEGKDF